MKAEIAERFFFQRTQFWCFSHPIFSTMFPHHSSSTSLLSWFIGNIPFSQPFPHTLYPLSLFFGFYSNTPFLEENEKNLYVPVASNDVRYNISKRGSLKAWIKATPILSLLVINFMFYFSHETELYNMIYYCIYRVTKLHSNWKGEAYWVNIA